MRKMAEVVLETEGLSKKYGCIMANDHISMKINKGDIYGFIGVNGAGKTTFMKLICDLIRPTEGRFTLLGASSTKALAEARCKMGVLIERPAFYTDMTALQNLIIQGRYKNIKPLEGKQTYYDILERVGLSDSIDKRIRDFSMGMKQRLGLALCLVGDPEFIVLDEPYVSLDPVGVNEFRTLLLQLNKEGTTILFSCHTLAEMTKVATRYGFIHKGKLCMELYAEQLEDEMNARNEDLEAFFLRHLEMWKE